MKVTKYIMIFSLIAGYSLAQAQQRPIYKAKPLSPEDIPENNIFLNGNLLPLGWYEIFRRESIIVL